MKVDLEQLAATAESIRAKVCIVGAGIAGLVLAHRLAATGVQVALLEGGGEVLEARSQALFRTEMGAEFHLGANAGRYRMLGGSSPYWGGQVLPFPAEVFVGGLTPGWPIAEAELQPYLVEAQKVLGVDELPFAGEEFLAEMERTGSADRFLPEGLRLRFAKWAPFARRNLATTLGRELERSGSVMVYLHANVTQIVLREDGLRVAAVMARNFAGAVFRFEAEEFVVAAGTIETARLLLASRSVAKAGVGNEFDQVGRYFHDHVSVEAAVLEGPVRAAMLRAFAPYVVRGTLHSAKLEATPKLREELGMLGVLAHVTVEEPEDSGVGLARKFLQAAQQGQLLRALVRDGWKLPQAASEMMRLGVTARLRRRRFVSERARVVLRIDCEQVPRAEARIRLKESGVDALGIRQAVLDWRVGAEEIATMRVFAGWLRERFPDVVFRDELLDEGRELTGVVDVFHPMGGARMGEDPQTSVVDADLRVHGIANLSVASAAVFPSGGITVPTLTLMGLAIRLADRLSLACAG